MISEESPAGGLTFCRGVSDLSTTDGHPLRIGEIQIVPGPFHSVAAVNRAIAEHVAGAETSLDGYWFTGPPQEVTLLVTSRDDLFNPWESSVQSVLNDLTRFMLIVQMMQLTSCRPLFDVFGPTRHEHGSDPWLHVSGPFERRPSLYARQARIDTSHVPQFEALSTMLGTIEQREAERARRFNEETQKRVVRTVWQFATGYFVRSHSEVDWYRTLVDLTTGLEAALSEKADHIENIVIRLRQRAAALLATEQDPPRNIFRDVGTLYDLRSIVVHGSDLRETRLDTLINRLSTAPADSTWALDRDIALDRIRDLLRRTLLARLCLAGEGAVRWDYGERVVIDDKEIRIDELITDDHHRHVLREYWQRRLRELDCAQAFEPAHNPQDTP
ncbi:MAG: hypothetical protein F4121_03865 [Acidimicrobiia bacterium]|nr:hypothetical protein [Acidimicrobiia bacterium]MYC44053.1 hypothetical protein [Acidimicrobiia bacterium]MYI19236.1 hypothetical protein [Acidimicrobiia bacterium]